MRTSGTALRVGAACRSDSALHRTSRLYAGQYRATHGACAFGAIVGGVRPIQLINERCFKSARMFEPLSPKDAIDELA
jgi:hypothetical protein